MPQGAFGLEQTVDELAERLGLDPLALRERIDARDESGAQARRAERRVGAERFGWSRRRPPGSDPGPVKRGLGMAQALWPRLVRLESSVKVRLTREGRAEIFSAVQDIGGGIRTVLAQVVAEELGLGLADVAVHIGDTAFPRGPSSGGSVTTASITPAARDAAARVRAAWLERCARRLKAAPADLVIAQGAVFSKKDRSRRLSIPAAAALIGKEPLAAEATRGPDWAPPSGIPVVSGYGGVQFAQVAVDVGTGRIAVERIVAVHDCGRPMNPPGVENQINGGILQGLSYALLEDRILDGATGRVVNADLEHYKIAGALEVPEIEIHLLEEYRGRSSTDAGGIGEPATVATAACIANAVYNALGVRLRALPMTPARVLAALASARQGVEP
jgi:xanthine dehydrogenase YagR molybdenum-binding subunit